MHEFKIPFVHATSNMPEEEYWYLVKNFKTEYFNLHAESEYPLMHTLSEAIRRKILIENSPCRVLTTQDVAGFAGLCVDLSHLEDSRRAAPEQYEGMVSLLRELPVMANHISAVSDIPHAPHNGIPHYSTHDLTEGSLDYLKQLPASSVSDLCAVEVENSLADQVKILDTVRTNLLHVYQRVGTTTTVTDSVGIY